MRILFLVTHLLGSGHLSRMIALADGASAAGHEAVVISGGPPAPHLGPARARLIQLPPVRSDGVDFRTLLDDQDQPASEKLLTARRAQILGALTEIRPDAVVTELFPLGRRVLAAEFEALTAAARSASPRPAIYCSVRDVLAAPSKPARVLEASERLARRYDALLAHGDPAIQRLEDSWPLTPEMARMTRYTGYVAPPPPAAAPDGDGAGEILVTAGGGPVGERNFQAALGAAAGSALRWRLLVGGADRAERVARLRAGAPENVIVEPVRPDFREMLTRAKLSVNQVGYNTALDLAAIGARSVAIPFAEAGETEQMQRAQAFCARYGWALLPEAELSPERLRAAVEAALAAPPPTAPPPNLDGVAGTLAILTARDGDGRRRGRGGEA